jgi:hypothetical protein
MKGIDSKIISRVYGRGSGTVITPSDFLDFGSRQAIDTALHRLVKKNVLRRISRGLYDFPRKDPVLGPLSPTTDAILKAVKRRDKIILQPSGGYAANLLGLSQQVPMRIVLLTSGPTRQIELGKKNIILKHTTPRTMATAGRVSGTVIQALRHIGQSNIDDTIVAKLKSGISQDDKKQLLKDVPFAPSWIAAVMRRVADK